MYSIPGHSTEGMNSLPVSERSPGGRTMKTRVAVRRETTPHRFQVVPLHRAPPDQSRLFAKQDTDPFNGYSVLARRTPEKPPSGSNKSRSSAQRPARENVQNTVSKSDFTPSQQICDTTHDQMTVNVHDVSLSRNTESSPVPVLHIPAPTLSFMADKLRRENKNVDTRSHSPTPKSCLRSNRNTVAAGTTRPASPSLLPYASRPKTLGYSTTSSTSTTPSRTRLKSRDEDLNRRSRLRKRSETVSLVAATNSHPPIPKQFFDRNDTPNFSLRSQRIEQQETTTTHNVSAGKIPHGSSHRRRATLSESSILRNVHRVRLNEANYPPNLHFLSPINITTATKTLSHKSSNNATKSLSLSSVLNTQLTTLPDIAVTCASPEAAFGSYEGLAYLRDTEAPLSPTCADSESGSVSGDQNKENFDSIVIKKRHATIIPSTLLVSHSSASWHEELVNASNDQLAFMMKTPPKRPERIVTVKRGALRPDPDAKIVIRRTAEIRLSNLEAIEQLLEEIETAIIEWKPIFQL